MNNIFFYNHDILAKTSINVLCDSIITTQDQFKCLFSTKDILFEKHKGVSVVQNAISYFLHDLKKEGLEKQITIKKREIELQINKKTKEIAEIAAKKIKNNSCVFVHSINNQIFEILLQASNYKKFEVNLVKHDPFNIENQFTLKLKNKNIKYNVFPDLAIEQAIEHSDVCFIGTESILKNKDAIVKTGTNVATNLAKKHNTPTYLCAHSWKFDFHNTSKQLLNHTIGKQPIKAFERIKHEQIESYIIESGIFKPKQAIHEIKYFNKWMRL
ncbi:hypothetical protein HN789_03925 [archaeon]|jgi:translation initiation factor 2B subunit (eIF-2B alpha/beta/delta family)|nr:hypothetical protein [archaeon]MBT4272509.1 hypothetical protein [archaeon]MBT4460607.1 hypothetical protein [archaeon]MBT7440364.1 hypothetical protein [archaeon]